jgi:NTP pyrophosphatase (non-canonical NTP hydrolase)
VTWESSSEAVRTFVDERDWSQFHSADNLAKSIAIEAGELLECFQWSTNGQSAEVERELADVLIYCLLLADRIGADVDDLIAAKIEENARKYPVDLARGRSEKYDRL